MDISERPLYTLYVVGYPCASTQYYPQAAEVLGINLKLEYHGCVIETLYADESGLEITDADVEMLKFEEENEIAEAFYCKSIGNDWLKQLRETALKLLKEKASGSDTPF